MRQEEAVGQRGKWAETEVEKVLRRMNEQYIGFAYDRLADARAAGGRLKSSLCDFLWWWKYDGGDGLVHKESGLLEVKTVKHDFRLAKDKLDQLPRMRKVRYAGASGIVLVFHSTLGKWRAPSLDFFDGELRPSWDLSALPLYDTAAKALASTCVFPTTHL